MIIKKMLHLTLMKKYFDQIAEGSKKIEYRENKPYWQTRLTNPDGTFKHFDIARFKNGYSKKAPVQDKKIHHIELNETFEIHLY